MPEPAKRACDACHRRKVKCVGDGSPTCVNCKSAQLTCTYNAVPQKKGPKGSRAKVISELRESQRQIPLTPWSRERLGDFGTSPPASPASSRGTRSLQPELINACVEFFFTNMYPTQPILDRDRLQQTIAGMSHSIDSYCLIYTLCAYMMIQPSMQLPPGFNLDLEEVTSPMALGNSLLAEAIEIRKAGNVVENPTLDTVTTSFFLFGCYFNLESANKAYFYLREATTFSLLIGMHEEATYQTSDVVEAILKRRLFWLLFVTERAYALQAQRPLTLHATIGLPEVNQNTREAVELTGFMHLIRLFRPFDDTFVGLWNQSIEGCNIEWIVSLQQQLSDALPKYLRCTETQAVDLRVSQQWLRIMVWQLSISNRLLSSASNDEAMTFRYPVELSRELATVAASFSQSSMEVHGIGLVKKLFDVACTLVDVMACVPIETNGFEMGPRDYLHNFLQVIGKLRGGQTRYLPMLLAKTNNDMPGMSEPIPRVMRLPSSVGGQFDELPERSMGPSDHTRSSRVPVSMDIPLRTDFAQQYQVHSPYSSAHSAQSPYDGVAPTVDPFSTSPSDFHG